MYFDLSEKQIVKTKGGAQYYVTLIDEKTRYVWIRLLKLKSDTSKALESMIREAERQTERKLKVLRTDNAGEYIAIDVFLDHEGAVHERSLAYSHESNELSERLNRTLGTMIRGMLASSNLPLSMWGEAVHTAVYVKNRLPHRAVKTTSYEELHGEKPFIKHLQSFEQKCYVHVLSEQRKAGSKLLPRAKEGRLVEYTSSTDKIYRIYISSEKRIVESRQVKFAPFEEVHTEEQQELEREPTKEEKEQPESVVLPLRSWRRVQRTNQQLQQRQHSQESQTDEESEQEESDPDDNEDVFVETKKPHEQRPEIVLPPPPADPEDYEAVSPEQTPEPLPQPRRNPPRESRRAPDRFGMMTTSVMEHAHTCAAGVMEEPLTHHEAMKSLQSDQWIKAESEELEAHAKAGTWEVVDRPKRPVVDSKWVYKIKQQADGSIERYKARLVARGFTQRPGYDFDETFSPVVRYESLRLLFALSAQRGWKSQQCDIKSAFLYSDLIEEIYMELPPGHRQANKVARLRKCIYGLKQASREWYSKLSTFLTEKNFTPAHFDPCVFIHKTEEVIVSVFVDDLVFYGPDQSVIARLIKELEIQFEVKNLGNATWLLGIHIEYYEDGITLSQTAYIEKLLLRYGMDRSNPVSTPMTENIKLSRGLIEEQIENPSYYQSIVGSIMYAVIGTRFDLAFTITLLSQYNSCPNNQHLAAAKHTLRRLSESRDFKLFFSRERELKLEEYSDAFYASCSNTR